MCIKNDYWNRYEYYYQINYSINCLEFFHKIYNTNKVLPLYIINFNTI